MSLTGVIGAKYNGNCYGSCGQIQDVLKQKNIRIAKNWDADMVLKLYETWERWHLNDLTAGLPIQEDFVREWKKTNKYDYATVCEVLKANNLYEIDGYKYGYKWLTEEVPQEVIDWLFALPETNIECAWGSYSI